MWPLQVWVNINIDIHVKLLNCKGMFILFILFKHMLVFYMKGFRKYNAPPE